MSDKPNPRTYQPITGRKNDFKLRNSSRGLEKRLHALQVRFAGVDLNERRGICNVEAWEARERIPELSQEVRVSISALEQMLKRTEDNDEELRENLDVLVKDFKKKVEPVPFISADEYWIELAKILLDGFEAFTDKHEVNPEDLNFKVLQEAYQDFF